MKCVNAVWDFRNLGVKTVKFEIEKNDVLEDCLTQIEEFRLEHEAKYVVIKSNMRYQGVSIFFQNAGFTLINNEIVLKLTREDVLKVIEKYKDFCDDVSYKLADEADMQLIYSELEKGIFKVSDYVALDPFFSKEQKNRRFILYVKDVIAQGAEVFLTFYKDKPLGFFIQKLIGNKKSDDKLGCVFNEAEANHQGGLSTLARCKHFIDSGLENEISEVSLTNLNVLCLTLEFGRKITGAKNVLVKHYD